MFAFLLDILPTLIGGAIFVIFAVGVITALSAIASKIEDHYQNQSGEITTDIGVDRRGGKIPTRRAA